MSDDVDKRQRLDAIVRLIDVQENLSAEKRHRLIKTILQSNSDISEILEMLSQRLANLETRMYKTRNELDNFCLRIASIPSLTNKDEQFKEVKEIMDGLKQGADRLSISFLFA